MRILLSATYLGGVGGMERSVYAMARALAVTDQVDIVFSHDLGGDWGDLPEGVTKWARTNWRWRGASRHDSLKCINSVRRQLLPYYDVAIVQRRGPDVLSTIRAGLRLRISAGLDLLDAKRDFDMVALEAPDNTRYVAPGTPTMLLTPPYYPLANQTAEVAELEDKKFFLTVFNPYHPVKGMDDLASATESSPLPIVWCHSQRTLDFDIPAELARSPKIVHLEDPSLPELRYLHERCRAYLCFSRAESFGWSLADALYYSPAVVSRRLGVLSFTDALDPTVHLVGDSWAFDWDLLGEDAAEPPRRNLTFMNPRHFRNTLAKAVENCAKNH